MVTPLVIEGVHPDRIAALAKWNPAEGQGIEQQWRDMCEILSGADRESTAFHILWDIRLPRLFAAALLGGALSVSGFLLQTFFANPIAGPFVLGISSGAKLVVAFVMILFL